MRRTSREWSHVGGADVAALRAQARRMLGEHAQDADDVVQDVLLAAHGRLDGKSAEEQTAYLHAMVRNRCVDEHRRNARWVPVAPVDDRVVVGTTPEDEPEQIIARRASIEHLTDDLLRLPERQREVMLAQAFDGCSHQQIADRSGMTPAQSRALLKRARSTLTAFAAARNAPCTDIRSQLDGAHARGVRPSEHARRHLWTCPACQAYRTARRVPALAVPAVQELLLHLMPGPATVVTGRIAAGTLALVVPTLVPVGTAQRDAAPAAFTRTAASPAVTASSFPMMLADRPLPSPHEPRPRKPKDRKPALTPEAVAASTGWSALARRQLASQTPAAQRRFVRKLAAACRSASGSTAPPAFLVRHCPDLVPADEPRRPARSAKNTKRPRPQTAPAVAAAPAAPPLTVAATEAAPPSTVADTATAPPQAAPPVAPQPAPSPEPPVPPPPVEEPPVEAQPPAPPVSAPVSEPTAAP